MSDYISKLNIWRMQNVIGEIPRYKVIAVQGPAHQLLFTMELRFLNRVWTGQGYRKKLAKHDAAEKAYKELVMTPSVTPDVAEKATSSDDLDFPEVLEDLSLEQILNSRFEDIERSGNIIDLTCDREKKRKRQSLDS